jgi:PAS domain S-box-containing protein
MSAMAETNSLKSADDLDRRAYERCPSALIVVTELGQINMVNEEAERLFGYARGELLGQPLERLVPGCGALGYLRLFEPSCARRELWQLGMRRVISAHRKDGIDIPVFMEASPMLTPDGICMMATVVKANEISRFEERLRWINKLEALGNTACGVAHDLNNILHAVIAFTEMAQESTSTLPSAAADLDKVLDAARRGRNLVSRILASSRNAKVERLPISFEPPVQEAIHLLKATMPAKIEMRTWFDPKAPLVLANGDELHQIAMNLGSNAAHAMKDCGGVLEIRIEPKGMAGRQSINQDRLSSTHYVQLSISDTGTGIPQDALSRIFDPFFTTKLPGEGTGLGLSVVDCIVRSLGGRIDVSSQVGKGTRFEVYLPAASPDPSLIGSSRRVPPG